MRFQRGNPYPHPPRGPARHKYTVTEAALRQRRGNLANTRLRSRDESSIIKLLIWQSFFEEQPQPSQRALARQLGVWRSYVCKVRKQATREGWDARIRYGQRVTLDDLDKAREFTTRLGEQGVLASAPARRLYAGELRGQQRRPMTADESITEQRRFAEEWKRKNPLRYDTRRRISVPIPR